MKRVITTPDAPSGNAAGKFPFSQAVVAGGLVFVAGQGPLDPDTGAIVEIGRASCRERVL